MEAPAAAPVNHRRNIATCVILVAASTLLLVAGMSWSWRSLGSWISSKVNSNVQIPFTDWQLELRLRLVRATQALPSSVRAFSEQRPITAKLYSIGVLCSPRMTLLWARLFDSNTLQLLHKHVDMQQASIWQLSQGFIEAVLPGPLARMPVLLLKTASQLAPSLGPLQQLAAVPSEAVFWPLWLLCPGLQVSYYALFFAKSAPLKVLYTCIIGVTRTVVEVIALWRCSSALYKAQHRTLVLRSLMCCYLLPLIMTFQSLSVLLWLCLFLPGWIVHLSMTAFYLWGPPMMLGLMTTAWAPHGRNAMAEAVQVGFQGIVPNDAQAEGHAAAEGAAEVVGGALQAFVKRISGEEAHCHWPPPVDVPDSLEELPDVPRSFFCPITHGIMREPAVAITGASYERSAITEWLKTRSRCPLTGRTLKSDQLSPNLALHSALQDWVDAQSKAQ